MEIRKITDKSRWENFVLDQKPDTFLHSWNWGEFQRITGEEIFRLGIFDDQELASIALIIKVNAKRGKFLFCPHGPLLANGKRQTANREILNQFFDYLKDLTEKEKVDFIRISPLLKDTPENLEIFRRYGFKDAPVHMVHPELSWLLDISRTEEEILKGMRKTTRNLIRRAEREGVEIIESKNISDVDKFYEIHEQTVGRHGFVPFSKSYLKKQFEALSGDNQISVFLARHNNQILSSAIIVFYGNSAFYHHGASLASKVPASHLLLWKIILEAKNRSCGIFNFWGIAPDDKPNHPWAGLTFFKTGFGGYKEEYLHAQDLIITKKYWLNWLIEKTRRWKRGY